MPTCPNPKKDKVVLKIYSPTLRQWIMDTGSFTNSECTFFFKGKQAYTRLSGLWPSSQGGTCYLFAQIKRRRKYLFSSDNQFTNSDKMGNKACRFFFKVNNSTRDFLITLAFQSVGDTKSNFRLMEW